MDTIVSRGNDGRNIGHDLTGQRFGMLTVLQSTGKREKNGYLIWRAQCDCGNVVERPSYRFMRGINSCGCGPVGRPRIPNHGSHFNLVYCAYRKGARDRGLAFELTKEEMRVLVESPCAYCGSPPAHRPTHRNLVGSYDWNGVDRVDNTKGYIAGNCVSCCSQCNWAKGNLTFDDFWRWVERVARHLGVTMS